MTPGSLPDRLVRGTRWSWRSDRLGDRLPPDLEATVMGLRGGDRLHAKQGRSTCRVRFESPAGPLSVYLKRHERLPWATRLAALLDPDGRHTPAGAEWRHLRRAEALGIPVPEPVAAGERIGPWGRVSSYLMVEELAGCAPLHEAIPEMAGRLDAGSFAAWKRRLVVAAADLTARLHSAHCFHKDLYLCHYFVEMRSMDTFPGRLYLIDLHRLATHRLSAFWGRWKDLGQLLFSTVGVAGLDDRDRLRFWARYRRRVRLKFPAFQRRMIELRAARYLAHHRRAAAR